MRFSLSSAGVAVSVIVLLSILAYVNVFPNEFVWDDTVFITDNPDVTSFRHAGHFFVEDTAGLYRPLRGMLYLGMYAVFDERPFGYHLMSLLFHAGVSVLVYLIARRLTGKSLVGLLAGLLFAVHPIHSERVINMTAGFDMLGILFYLGAFYCYLLYSGSEPHRRELFWWSLGLFVLGLLSSEEVATLPLVIVLYEFCFHRERFLGQARSLRSGGYLTFFGILAGYLVLRFGVLGIGGRMEEYLGGSFLATQMTMIVVYAKYLWMMVWPVGLTLFHRLEPVGSVFEPRFLASLLLLICVLGAALWHQRRPVALFSVGWFFITLLPVSNLVPLQVFMAERYLYLPSAGFTLLAAWGIYHLYRGAQKRGLRWGSVAIVLVVLSVIGLSLLQTTVRASEWRDELMLWGATIEDVPGSSRAYDNLGFAYEGLGDEEKAFGAFARAVELDGRNYRALANLGVAYAKREEYGESITHLQRSLAINPDYHKTHDKLGLVYAELGDFQKAEEHLRRAVELEPRYAKGYNDLGAVLGQQGRFGEAERMFVTAISLDESYEDARRNLQVLRDFLADGQR